MVVPRRYGLASCLLQRKPAGWYVGSRTRRRLTYRPGTYGRTGFRARKKLAGPQTPPARPGPASSQPTIQRGLILFRNVATQL
jgi:hypothetical protein